MYVSIRNLCITGCCHFHNHYNNITLHTSYGFFSDCLHKVRFFLMSVKNSPRYSQDLKCIWVAHLLSNVYSIFEFFRISHIMKGSAALQAMTKGAQDQGKRGRIIFRMQGIVNKWPLVIHLLGPKAKSTRYKPLLQFT